METKVTRFFFIILTMWCTTSMAASFDCSKAASLAEMMICNDRELSKLDDELSVVYRRARAAAKDKKQFNEQSRTSWKWREANCHSRECLLNWYAQRRITLEKYIKAGFIVNASNVIHLTFKEASEGAELQLRSNKDEDYPSKMRIYYNQTILGLDAVFDGKERVELPYVFNIGYETDGEMTWEKTDNKYAIAQYDITGDGVDEILFTVLVDNHDGFSSVEVNVLKFFPPQRYSDLGRKENWTLIGDVQASGIVGVPRVLIEDQTIKIPRNHRGFYYGISWVKDKFIDNSDY